jgi:hypothetical protein
MSNGFRVPIAAHSKAVLRERPQTISGAAHRALGALGERFVKAFTRMTRMEPQARKRASVCSHSPMMQARCAAAF